MDEKEREGGARGGKDQGRWMAMMMARDLQSSPCVPWTCEFVLLGLWSWSGGIQSAPPHPHVLWAPFDFEPPAGLSRRGGRQPPYVPSSPSPALRRCPVKRGQSGRPDGRLKMHASRQQQQEAWTDAECKWQCHQAYFVRH